MVGKHSSTELDAGITHLLSIAFPIGLVLEALTGTYKFEIQIFYLLNPYSFVVVVLGFFLVFLGQGFTIQFRLGFTLLCSPSWPQTHSDLHPSASQVLGLPGLACFGD